MRVRADNRMHRPRISALPRAEQVKCSRVPER